MPDPTKEEFDAAAKRVLSYAPTGLSREQFFGLIDKELKPTPEFSMYGEDGPPKSAENTATMLRGMAHPQSWTDIGNILAQGGSTLSDTPAMVSKIAGAIPNLKGAAQGAAKATGAVLQSPAVKIGGGPGMGPWLGHIGEALSQWAEASGLPSPEEASKIVSTIKSTGATLGDWDKKFIDSMTEWTASGRDLSPSQASNLRRIAATVAKPPVQGSGMGQMADAMNRAATQTAGVPRPLVEGPMPQAAGIPRSGGFSMPMATPRAPLPVSGTTMSQTTPMPSAGSMPMPSGVVPAGNWSIPASIGKQTFTAAEVARGIAMLKIPGMTQEKVIQILMSQRPK